MSYHKQKSHLGKKNEIRRLQKLHTEFEAKVSERIKQLSVLPEERLTKKALQESEELFRSTFEHAAIGIAHVDPDTGRWIRVNKRFCEIAGWSEKELLQQTFLHTTHPDDHKVDLELIGDMIQGKVSSIAMEKRYIRKDGSIRWVHATASVARYPSGKPKYGIAIVEDIHEKKEAEEKMKLLTDASRILASSLDYNETLSAIAELTVPQFADWCTLDLLDEQGNYTLVKVAYADPAHKFLADELYEFSSKKHDRGCYTGEAVSSKKSILVRKVSGKQFQGCPYGGEAVNKVFTAMNVKSYMVVPLLARGKALGVMILRSSQASRLYSKKDVAFIEQIANRAALAVDNARLYEKAQKAVQVRDDFLSIASHELKTSLTTIKALTQILQKNSQQPRSTDLLSKMDMQLNRTTKLINDLLDVGRIHSGKIVARKELFDLAKLVEEVVDHCQRLANGHSILVEMQAREKLYADRDHISQVLMNLILNGMKYSPDAKKIIVSVAKSKKQIVIGVKDYGIGVTKERQKRIFERFFRADNSMREKTSGLGLGLYISKQLVKQNDGDIWVESIVGKGSTFYVSFSQPTVEDKIANRKLLTKKLVV